MVLTSAKVTLPCALKGNVIKNFSTKFFQVAQSCLRGRSRFTAHEFGKKCAQDNLPGTKREGNLPVFMYCHQETTTDIPAVGRENIRKSVRNITAGEY